MYTFTTEMEHDPTNDSKKKEIMNVIKAKGINKIF